MANVLITGANGGFGRLAVQELLDRDHAVVATMRDTTGRNAVAARDLTDLGAIVEDLDVTAQDSVDRAVAAAISQLGYLDAVVNNAGVGTLGVQEAFTADDWRRLFDVNVFGVQRVVRAVSPHFRQRRTGLILQISSLLGRVALPFYGPYNASKWALEGMTESYRVELAGFGVDVAIVEPGGYPTTFVEGLMRPSDTRRTADLAAMSAAADRMLEGFEQTMAGNPAQDPRAVTAAIAKVIETPAGRRPFRTVVDFLGMGDRIRPYNDQLETLTDGLYTAFGIGHMRRLATGAEGKG
ncbi:MAG: SDR family oxidoreductase [Candidatus Krumholzibacteriia bacterium]